MDFTPQTMGNIALYFKDHNIKTIELVHQSILFYVETQLLILEQNAIDDSDDARSNKIANVKYQFFWVIAVELGDKIQQWEVCLL